MGVFFSKRIKIIISKEKYYLEMLVAGVVIWLILRKKEMRPFTIIIQTEDRIIVPNTGYEIRAPFFF